MAHDVFDYPRWMRDALRQVARRALAEVAESGLPEPHHFYLSFHTDHPDVEIPEFLRDRYPEEMTVVVQHQFWDLVVDDEGFSVGLSFGGRPQQIYVPFKALTTFLDPAAEFGLRFDLAEAAASPEVRGPMAVPDLGVAPPEAEDSDEAATESAVAPADGDGDDEIDGNDGDDGGTGQVVSIDRFRKK